MRPILTAYRRAMSTAATPVEDAMRTKLSQALELQTIDIINNSHLHSHHKAMQGSTSKETHFKVTLISKVFQSKTQMARHRMIYALLKDEMKAEGGIHALELTTRTPEEEAKRTEPN